MGWKLVDSCSCRSERRLLTTGRPSRGTTEKRQPVYNHPFENKFRTRTSEPLESSRGSARFLSPAPAVLSRREEKRASRDRPAPARRRGESEDSEGIGSWPQSDSNRASECGSCTRTLCRTT